MAGFPRRGACRLTVPKTRRPGMAPHIPGLHVYLGFFLPLPPPLDGRLLTPDCLTVKVCPAMVIVPVLAEVLLWGGVNLIRNRAVAAACGRLM